MGNVYINLPATSGNGAGAWVDMSTQGGLKTISVGGALIGTVNIEVSNELVATKGVPIKSFNGKGDVTLQVAAKWMRAVVVGYKSGGAPEVDIGGSEEEVVLLNLVPPAGNGAGAAGDSSDMPLLKTITVAGSFAGSVLIQFSEDLGITWSTLTMFTQAGHYTGAFAAERMRVVRSGITAAATPGTPLVNIAAVATGGSSGPGFGDPQIVRYVATGGESDFTVTFATAGLPDRANDLYDVFPANQGVTNIVGIDCPDTIAGDRTAAGFRVVTSGALTTGDVLTFLCATR